MKFVCYAFINEKNELQSPFLEYLEKYSLSTKDSDSDCELKVKRITNIKVHLDHLLQNNGRYHLPPLAAQYRNTEIGILKIKEGKSLVRIAFFTRIGEEIILLGAFDKPNLYEKGKKKKIDRFIQNFLHKVERYRKDYLLYHRSIPLPQMP